MARLLKKSNNEERPVARPGVPRCRGLPLVREDGFRSYEDSSRRRARMPSTRPTPDSQGRAGIMSGWSNSALGTVVDRPCHRPDSIPRVLQACDRKLASRAAQFQEGRTRSALASPSEGLFELFDELFHAAWIDSYSRPHCRRDGDFSQKSAFRRRWSRPQQLLGSR